MSDEDDEIETADPCVWAVAERLFEADRKPYDAPTLEAARPCDIDAICEWAEGFIATARHLGLTASDLAGLAEGTHVVVPVEPTLEMLQAGHFEHRTLVMSGTSGMTMRSQTRSECAREYACYRAMLAARPAAKEEWDDE